MTRPRAVVDGGAADHARPLDQIGAAPYDLSGEVFGGVVGDDESADAALDAVMRGADIAVTVDLAPRERQEFLDQLARVADIVTVTKRPSIAQPGRDHYALLRELRSGATLEEAARRLAMSRRTAARRLSELRDHHRVSTVAELISSLDPDI